jgi:hypothetical protein
MRRREGAGGEDVRRREGAGGEDVRANRAYELIVSRGGIEPAFLADRDRLDRIEVVSIDDGEVVLYWDLPAKDAARLAKMLRTDLVNMDADEFIRAWEGTDAEEAE